MISRAALSLQAGESVTAPQKQSGSLESMMALVAAMQQKKAAAIRNIQQLTNTKTQLKERSLLTQPLGRNYTVECWNEVGKEKEG